MQVSVSLHSLGHTEEVLLSNMRDLKIFLLRKTYEYNYLSNMKKKLQPNECLNLFHCSNLNGRYLNGELPETFEYQGMYWYDWHGPGYSLMKSRISVRSSKHSHLRLRLQDPKLLNNKTNKIQGKKKHPTVHNNTVQPLYRNTTGHKEYGPEQSITEEPHEENLGKEDIPPINEYTHSEFQLTTESLPHYVDDI
jgi:hypothetical protein